MDRVTFIDYKGKQMLFMDFRNCISEEVVRVIKEARGIIDSKEPGSLLTLVDMTNAAFNKTVVQKLQEFVTANQPYVKAAALVGMSDLQKIIVDMLKKVSHRELAIFTTLDEAKDYLAGK